MKKLVAWVEEGDLRLGSESGKALRKALRMAGFWVDSGWANDKRVKPEDENVEFSITNGNPDIPWVAYGERAAERLTGYKFSKFTDLRGTFLPAQNGKWLVASIHPSFVIRGGGASNPDGEDGKAQMALFPFLALDAQRATQTPTPWVPTIHCGIPRELPPSGAIPAIDIEGGYGAPISLVGISWEPNIAWVMPYGPDVVAFLKRILQGCTPIFHNAAYDIPALEQEGIEVPNGWIDTINTAALLNPSVKVGLEAQVLSYVPGSVAWKGLINHRLGYQAETAITRLYERLHTEVLTSAGKSVPKSRFDWYVYYNGLDTSGTRMLVPAHKRELEGQGRADYYRNVMQPLQEPLLRMGLRGVPVDLDRMAHHRTACERIERMAQKILDKAASGMMEDQKRTLICAVAALEEERDVERACGIKAFTKGKQLSIHRTKLRAWEGRDSFKGTSIPQRIGLLYNHLGLPEVRHRKTGNLTTDEDSIRGLMLRLQKGSIKPNKATTGEALRVCRALIATSVWSKWKTGFLNKGEA